METRGCVGQLYPACVLLCARWYAGGWCLMGAFGAASLGPEWTSPLEVRAAVSCWRLQ